MAKPVRKGTTVAITALLYIFLCVVGYSIAETAAKWNWAVWASHMYQYSLSDTYQADNNHAMPLMQYILWVYAKIVGGLQNIATQTSLLKVVSLAFEFVGAWYIYKYINKRLPYLVVLLLCVVNIGYIYNSLVWNGMDSIFVVLNFIAVYYAYEGRLTRAAFFYILAFNANIYALILLPVMGYYYLLNIAQKKNSQSALLPIVAITVTQFILLLPFIFQQDGWHSFSVSVKSPVNQYPLVSVNAYNVWNFLLHFPSLKSDVSVFFAGLTYKRVGVGLFILSSVVIIFPLIKSLVLLVRRRGVQPLRADKLLLICGLLFLSFYFFNTQMQVQYVHPAIIFLVTYSFIRGKYLLYILFTLTYFLAQESIIKWLGLNYDTFLFNPLLSAGGYMVILVYGIYLLYSKEKR